MSVGNGARGWNLEQAVKATKSTYVKSASVAAGIITVNSQNIKVSSKGSFNLILVPSEQTTGSSVGTALNWEVSSTSSCLKADLC